MAAKLASMDRQTLRDWIFRYDEHGVDDLSDHWGAGGLTAVGEGDLAAVKAPILQAAWRSGVAAMIEERTGVRYSVSGAHLLMKMGLWYQKTCLAIWPHCRAVIPGQSSRRLDRAHRPRLL